MPLADNLVIENAEFIFRNFAGAEKQFNSEGDRNFCIILKPELADRLKREGWNVKELRAREEGEEPRPYLQVAVNFNKGRPPRIVLITSRSRTELGVEQLPMLDYADIKVMDVVLNPYEWNIPGNPPKTGIKAYLKNAFITLNEDELELKYAEDPTNQTPVMSSTANEPVMV